ncbi:sulfurtransferase [Erythrobacter sp. MTPC3]|uniref:sulfurtransferase n=1 Tax=Erythrobacter sp. MTPC3 TaxID=3056564 RepID=UPI0036F2E41F
MNERAKSLISTAELAARLNDGTLTIVDASRHLPAAQRDARAEFDAGHIPGARFLDLESLTDPASPVPAAVPTGDQLAQRLGSLGAVQGSTIVIYDDSAVKTSARAWFILIAHGWDNVMILDGGLAKWKAENRPLESGETPAGPVPKADFPQITRIRSKADMLANIETCAEQVVDARGADRVYGKGTDPVHGGENGRIPGSCNVPFGDLFNADGTFKSPADLRAAFEQAGVDLDRPVTATCGSGVTASVLLFALHLIGKIDTALYDGSWQEWSADPATPKNKGPA